ncbi:TIGR02117 family protein [Neolewinella aurantiaca]|nr:TIGR02117 family protein [Neolewinella aurantiaca]
MKGVFLFSGKVLAWLFLFLGIYVGLSFLLSYIPVNTASSNKSGPNRIYAHSNGVHLDLVFPLEMVPDQLLSQLAYAPGTTMLAIGWGDKGFYLDTPTWAELSPKVAIKAMFLPSATAMHVTEHAAVHATWSHINLSDEQLSQLWAYIIPTFRTDANGQVMELVGKGYTEHDRFYEAHGNYSMFKTCNTWVNIGLRRIGVKTAVWTPMDTGVLRFLD